MKRRLQETRYLQRDMPPCSRQSSYGAVRTLGVDSDRVVAGEFDSAHRCGVKSAGDCIVDKPTI
jgi:hypothetical protein